MMAWRITCLALLLMSFGCKKKPAARPYPLHWAVGNVDRAEVLSLLAAGADINSKDWYGLTPLQHAARTGQVGMVELLIAHGAVVDANSAYWGTPLHCAAEEGHVAAARRLIAAGARINVKSSWHHTTPLQIAFLCQHIKAADLLLGAGADPNARDEWGRTVLHDAALNGQMDFAELFTAKGAPPNARDNEGLMPSHEAAWENRLEMARLLLAHGAEVNARDVYGQTPLHVAAINGFTAIFDLLVAQGADVNMRDESGLTPLDYIRSPAAPPIVTMSADGKGPCSVIVAKPNTVRHFLRDQQIAFDRVWIPQKQDIESLNLKAAIEQNPQTDPQAANRRRDVLHGLTEFNREYAGFVAEGRKYIFCNLDYWSESNAQPTDGEFAWVSQARVVIDPADGTAIRIYCNGY